ncbi:unnamed protein product [Ambrosiozyma monospora]|uniref:Unnamed protein product n=1 Tax=Ambrosiozyma monospora TaxID=43982 RepID=A0A9W7DEX6_AMBMO|nr:unnamed protein product [Ambrosiozyma monospora]
MTLKSLQFPPNAVIIAGAGIAGLCSAYQAIQNGANVILIDKNLQMGGNSSLASTGINGIKYDEDFSTTKSGDSHLTISDEMMLSSFNCLDSPDLFKHDLIMSSKMGNPKKELSGLTRKLIDMLCDHCVDSVRWLEKISPDLKFDRKVSVPGCSYGRTLCFRDGKLPGFVILQCLLNLFLEKCKTFPEKYMLLNHCKLIDFIKNDTDDGILGVICDYSENDVKSRIELFGPVILATGGFGHSFEFISKYKHDLDNFATASKETCVSEVIELVVKAGGELTNMDNFQMIATGLVPFDSDFKAFDKVSICSKDVLKCGILINEDMKVMNGSGQSNERICKLMSKSKNNYLVLDSNEAKFNQTLSSLDKRAYITKITVSKLTTYLKTDVSTLTKLLCSNGIDCKHIKVLRLAPTIHIPLGGLKVTETMELEGVKNCYATGEIVGGIHGAKMIIGTALLSCVVFGRMAADNATSFLLSKLSNKVSNRSAIDRLTQLQNHLNPSNEIITEQFKIPDNEYQIEEIAKHNSKDDCWLVVKNVVLDL